MEIEKRNLYIDSLIKQGKKNPEVYRMLPDISEAGKLFVDEVTAGKIPVTKLLVTVLANQSGKLVNMRVYPSKAMKKGYKNWVGGTWSKKVLLNHNETNPPVGIVIDAKYKALLTGTALTEDYMTPALDPNEPGSGNGILTLSITDTDAIQRILRKEYDAVSTGADIWPIYCSICRNVIYSMECTHLIGHEYEIDPIKGDKKTKLCYGIASKWEPMEVSIVNIPAFNLTQILSIESESKEANDINESFRNSIKDRQVSFIAYNDKKNYDLSDERCNMTIKSIAVNGTKKVEPKTLEELLNPDELITEPAKDEEIAAVAPVATVKPVTEVVEAVVEKVVEKVVEGIVEEVVKEVVEEVVEEVEDTLLFESDEEFATAHILDNLSNNDMLDDLYDNAEDTLTAFDIENLISKFKEIPTDEIELDKRLSAKQRKALKSSQFCGPNRSFPVPNCDYVIVAKRLLPRAKVSDATKAKILACINKKAKAFGCNKDNAPSDSIRINELQELNDSLTLKIEDVTIEMNALKVQYDSIKKCYEDSNNDQEELVKKLSSIVRHYLRLIDAKDIDENSMDFDALVKAAIDKFDTSVKKEKVETLKTSSVENDSSKQPKIIKVPGNKVASTFLR